LEVKLAQEEFVLVEVQLSTLEKVKDKKEAEGEIESELFLNLLDLTTI
jgi:hypothetical protein